MQIDEQTFHVVQTSGNSRNVIGRMNETELYGHLANRLGGEASSHRFRHKFAVELLLHGVSMEDVSTLLGHRDIKITQRMYSASTPARRDAGGRCGLRDDVVVKF